MKIYKTTNNNYIAKINDKEFYVFDESINNITGADDSVIGQPSSALRSDAKAYNQIETAVNELVGKKNARTIVDKINGYDVFFDKETFGFFVDFNGQLISIDDKDLLVKLKASADNIKKLQMEIKPENGNFFRLGDRVLLYGPTGTGKTFSFLSSVNELIKDGKLNDFTKVTITEGFEDIDFFANIVPVEGGGIKFQEKKIVELFRRAAAGEKIAILLDELNRGSKSLLNLILTMLDPVDDTNYYINNFINDEIIVVPMENILWFAAMNLGGKYTGTNVLDEALFDRFNIVRYSGYNLKIEDKILDNFGEFKEQASKVVKHIRECSNAGEVKSSISTRGIKAWAEKFINSAKSGADFLNTFDLSILYRIISVDDSGVPNEEEKAIILQKFKELGFIK